jgi:hypothetical protein
MVALTGFVCAVRGTNVIVRPGDLFAPDDAVVKNNPAAFGPAPIRESGPVIEQATAAPGEKRGA